MSSPLLSYLLLLTAAPVWSCLLLSSADLPGFLLDLLHRGGLLEVAQFLPTTNVDSTLHKTSSSTPADLGLLVDARCDLGVRVIRRIMESPSLTKLIWGADADIISLTHHAHLEITCRSVVDVQLAYCDPSKRLGMAKMLQSVVHPQLHLLPRKEKNDTQYHPQARNCRCCVYPLDAKSALYSMDDVHRIDMILNTKTPFSGSYNDAKNTTERYFLTAQNTPDAALAFLNNELQFYDRKYSMAKSCAAVQYARGCVAIELRFASSLTDTQRAFMVSVRTIIDEEINRLGLTITSLAWADD
mmetsp:Transcript_23439/g.50672  ORF Transcript_23439/g.50672 Transcript_23439/m.50672 type:complete len:300 (-) Transcript_23439:112-1011(-)